MSLLVIEDLDGRLVYARAGDGEAVFGSDGEFEFADDSSDWWESDDDDENEADVEDAAVGVESTDPLLLQQPSSSSSSSSSNNTNNDVAGPSTATTATATTTTKSRKNLTTSAESSLEPDEGETTDELGYEEMPYPRLLVGSIAPRGSGTSRARARANAQARRANNALAAVASNTSINGKSHPPNSAITPGAHNQGSGSGSSSSSTVPGTPKIPSPSMAPGTLPSTPGASTAPLIDPMATPSLSTALATMPQPPSTPGAASTSTNVANSGVPLTPFRRPEMGTFIPSQDKAVHRAIIDGANKAPSPYQRGKNVMTRGLAPKRKHDESDGRSSRQRNERRAAASRGRSPMSMSSSRMNGGPNSANGNGINGGGSGSNGSMLGGSSHPSNGPSSSSSLPRRMRKKARTAVVDMDPGISLDELLDMELLSEGGLVQR